MASTTDGTRPRAPTTAEAFFTPVALYEGWELSVYCGSCRTSTGIHVARLAKVGLPGPRLVKGMPRAPRMIDLVARLSCNKCGARPNSVKLFDFHGGTARRHPPTEIMLLEVPPEAPQSPIVA